VAIEGLNVNNLTVDDKGRVSFSGLGSGIDFQGTVDKIIAARRIPVDTLETRVSDNTDKITALTELRDDLAALQTSLAKLYGAVSFQNASNIFEAKQAFASVSRLDGATPTAAGTLVGVSVTNAASAGNHTVEVLRIAKAHKIASDSFASTSTALGFTTGDTFTVEGVTITVNASDTLTDLRDRINAANSGSSATGVTASIVSAGATENYLLLSKDDTGAALTLADTRGTPLQTIGVLTGAGAVKNELQAAQTAQFYADGLLDQTNTIYESAFQTAGTVQVGSTGALSFTLDSDGSPLGTVNYNSTDSLSTLAANITANVTGVTATVVTDGAGVRLEISGAAGFSFTESGAGTAISDLEINNKRRVIERDSNTISDLFSGVTLTLFQAEKGTTVSLDVEKDLSQVKTEILSFVDAYNALRAFINSNRLIDSSTGTKSSDAGALFSSRALAEVQTKLGNILGTGTAGVSAAFSTLGQIGISFAPTSSSDPLLANTLEIDESKLDAALLNSADDVRRLFTFDFTSSDPRVTLLSFDRNTTYSASGYTLNLQPNSGENLFQYSEQADNAYWTAANSTISADGATAPDGSTTADGLVADINNTSHYLTNTAGVSLTAGESYIFSTYIKAGDKSEIRLNVGGSAVNNDAARALFDIGAGTLTSTTVTDAASNTTGVDEANIESVGDGWYRVSMKVTATATGTAFFERYVMSGGGASYAGDGSTVNAWFWGAQMENAGTDTTVLSDADLSPNVNTAISADVAAAPDGNATADGIVADAVSGAHFVSNTAAVAVTAGEQYDYVAYVQAGARTRVQLSLSGGDFAASTNAQFDLAAGTVTGTGAGADSAAIEAVAGSPGWYKVTVTATATGTGTNTHLDLYARDAATGNTFTGDGATVDTYFWNQQLVHKEAPVSYVGTTGSTVTGAAATANIDGDTTGVDDGSATVNGNSITVTSGDAQGLKLFYTGFTLPESVQLDFTVGVGAQLYFAITNLIERTSDSAGNPVRGAVEGEIDTLTDQNEVSNDRITEMLARLEIQRQSLIERFLNMEQAMARAESILNSIKRTTDAMFGSNS
jgi:flagellar hook-associated protein 2